MTGRSCRCYGVNKGDPVAVLDRFIYEMISKQEQILNKAARRMRRIPRSRLDAHVVHDGLLPLRQTLRDSDVVCSAASAPFAAGRV